MYSKSFTPLYWSLEEMFGNIYNVPVYQRPYSWDAIEEVDVLLNDLINSYKEDKFSEYYTGSIIIHDKNEKINGYISKFEIIDGQQRITTFALILLSLYSISVLKGYENIQNIKSLLWKYIDRKYEKQFRTINLNSIEKNAFENLYDYCFQIEDTKKKSNDNNEDIIIKYCNEFNKKNKFEERIFQNFQYIYNFIINKCSGKLEEILNFSDYLLKYVRFIVIETTCQEKKVFSIFESINSKGKNLEPIDLIKIYIFSNINPKHYEKYLKIWGNLIIETDDKLYDYIYNFIKAFIYFYRQNISIKYFKSLCKKELLEYYNEFDVSKALELFLDDLYSNVKYYKMLFNTELAYKLVLNSKFRYYYQIFTDIEYQHPRPLFLRALIEYSKKKIDKNTIINTIVEIVKFMLEFISISGKDSKDVVSMFAAIMNEIYNSNIIKTDIVNNAIFTELIKQGITSEQLKADLQNFDGYNQKKQLAKILLSLYDSSDDKENLKISYDEAYFILKNFSATFSLDHLLVQTPDKTDKFKYYKDERNNRLILKTDADFPKNIIVNGMDYDMFLSLALNKIGNLRIYYKDKNSGRQNKGISLKEYPNFYNYKNVVDRGEDIANLIVDKILIPPNVDLAKIKNNSTKKNKDILPKMNELIKSGFVNIGDSLYITVNPNNSKAILLDSKNVNFNGKKMTLNDWGCEVTKWKSIRIYAYVARVGEKESLQKKREKLMELTKKK